MTRQETQAVLAVIKVAFPNFQKDKTRDDLTAVVNLWYLQFEDYDFDLVNAAVQALIAEQVEGYPLTIGEALRAGKPDRDGGLESGEPCHQKQRLPCRAGV